jgi:hypothetical protein
MATSKQAHTGLALLAAGLAAAALCYYLSWRAGCTFDSKTGLGSFAESKPFSLGAWVSAAVSLLLLAAAVPVGWHRSWAALAGSVLFFIVLGGPLLVALLWAGETAGVSSCAP